MCAIAFSISAKSPKVILTCPTLSVCCNRGYGFVEMDTEGASSVLGKLDNTDFMGRTIIVNEAHPKQERQQYNSGSYGSRGRGQF